MDSADLVQGMNTLRWENRMDRYANVSALCLFIWDYFLTFPQEVRYFWGSHWSFVKILFFLNRYLTMVLIVFTVFFDLYSTPDTETCLIWAKFEVFAALFCAFIVEVIMQIRLHAMYDHNKRLIFVVSVLCIGELMSMASLSLAKFPTPFAGLAEVPNAPWTLPFCNNVIPDHFYPYWIAFMIFDTIILVLVIRKAYMHYQAVPGNSRSNATLMGVLVRDSVLYFLCNVIVFLSTTLLWRYGPQALATVANSWSLVIPSTSAGRLLLNMRNAYKPSSDRISTAGLSGLGSLHIVCQDSRRAAADGESYFDDSENTSDDDYGHKA
ncbi:hypothetical protein MVEN_00785100 [Mycena venus]|uniref:DUF6533 domain-containing protein n=1 Tax=Mycena venus TaxID=2733690 RepID=A0A8H6YG37_9AGAR|nr:hypothetical protein MVEN_00785100 [Mycena venus]